MYYNTKSYKYISTKHTILNVYKDTNKMRFRIQKKKRRSKTEVYIYHSYYNIHPTTHRVPINLKLSIRITQHR